MQVPDSIIAVLARRYGADRESLRFLGGGHAGSDGIVYTFPSGGETAVLKFMAFPPGDEEPMLMFHERLRFVRFLGEQGVGIVYPELSPEGRLVEEVCDGEKRYVAYRMPLAPGEPVGGKHWGDPFFREWGRVVGKLHRCSRLYPHFTHSPVEGQPGRTVLGWEQEWDLFANWCKDEEVRQNWRETRARLEALPVTRESFGFIHNDPHWGNLLVDGERLTLLDFDVANYHWFINDVGIAVHSALSGGGDLPPKEPGFGRRFLGVFMRGYEQENHLDPFWLEQLELFLHYRRTLVFIVFYDALKQKNPDRFASLRRRILEVSPVME